MTLPRRLELALRAFPKRFRAANADEIRGVFADAHEAGDTSLLGVRAVIDLTIAGWRERLRTRPPVRRFLAYRFAERTLPAAYHRWMFDDVGGRWYFLRCFLWALLPTMVVVAPWFGLAMWNSPLIVGYGVAVALVAFASSMTDVGDRRRRLVLERHGYGTDMQWPPPSAYPRRAPFVPAPRSAFPAVPLLGSLGVALFVAGAIGWTVLWHSLGPVVQFGPVEVTRTVDHARPVALGCLAASILLGVVGLASLRRVRRRILTDVVESDVVERPTRACWVPAGVVVAMGGLSMLPITPMVLPAALVALAGGAPVLLVLAASAARRHTSGGGQMWVVRDGGGATARAVEPR